MNMSGRQAMANSWINFLEKLNNHFQMVERVMTKVHPKCQQAYTCDLIKNAASNYSIIPNSISLTLFSSVYNK